MSDRTELGDFGGGITDEPPQIRKRKAVHGGHSPDGSSRKTGHYGTMPNRPCPGFYTKRDSETHKIHAIEPDGAYAISDDVLEKLSSMGVGRILIHEYDTDRVLEFRFKEFADGPSVPDHIGTDNDPQTYQRPGDAWAIWDGHGDDVVIPRGSQ